MLLHGAIYGPVHFSRVGLLIRIQCLETIRLKSNGVPKLTAGSRTRADSEHGPGWSIHPRTPHAAHHRAGVIGRETHLRGALILQSDALDLRRRRSFARPRL